MKSTYLGFVVYHGSSLVSNVLNLTQDRVSSDVRGRGAKRRWRNVWGGMHIVVGRWYALLGTKERVYSDECACTAAFGAMYEYGRVDVREFRGVTSVVLVVLLRVMLLWASIEWVHEVDKIDESTKAVGIRDRFGGPRFE